MKVEFKKFFKADGFSIVIPRKTIFYRDYGN